MYIPDITERFPEGYGGVDMTPSFFNEPVDWSRAYQSNEDVDDGMEIPFEIEYESIFKVGQSYRVVGVYGGVTYYIVKEIDRENNKILLAEKWEDLDGTGTRPSEWHHLEVVDGKEMALEWESKHFGKFWIYAYNTER